MSFEGLEIGKSGEQIACRFLKSQGMKILGTNVRMSVGEIDILASDKDTIVIVEVKTRTDKVLGNAEEKVDLKKQKKLRMIAKELSIQYPDSNLRIDVIALNNFNKSQDLSYIKNAVEG